MFQKSKDTLIFVGQPSRLNALDTADDEQSETTIDSITSYIIIQSTALSFHTVTPSLESSMSHTI